MLLQEILENTPTHQLIIISKEINEVIIPREAICRKLAAQTYNVSIENTTLLQLIGLAPLLARELGKRLTNLL